MTTSKVIKMSNGSEIWMKNKRLHREDGPALYSTISGRSSFYLEGRQYRFEDWVKKVKISSKNLTILCLKHSERSFDE